MSGSLLSDSSVKPKDYYKELNDTLVGKEYLDAQRTNPLPGTSKVPANSVVPFAETKAYLEALAGEDAVRAKLEGKQFFLDVPSEHATAALARSLGEKNATPRNKRKVEPDSELKEAISGKRRRRLGLFKLNKSVDEKKQQAQDNKSNSKSAAALKQREQNYSDVLPLHTLWNQYATSVLGDLSTAAAIGPKLVKMDFHGAKVAVVRSKTPQMIGLEGIIIQETMKTLMIVTPKNTVKCIPKTGSVFAVPLPSGVVVDLFGSQIAFKPAERAVRKFKTRPTMDL